MEKVMSMKRKFPSRSLPSGIKCTLFVNTHILWYFSKSYQWMLRGNKWENEKEGMWKGRERERGRKEGKEDL